MSEFTDHLTDDHRIFIEKQPVFFIATAAPDARINLSPKGMDSFRVLGATRIGYLDVSGSGNETHAHLAADGRATIMFCAFDRESQTLKKYAKKFSEAELLAKISTRTKSIDGLPIRLQDRVPSV